MMASSIPRSLCLVRDAIGQRVGPVRPRLLIVELPAGPPPTARNRRAPAALGRCGASPPPAATVWPHRSARSCQRTARRSYRTSRGTFSAELKPLRVARISSNTAQLGKVQGHIGAADRMHHFVDVSWRYQGGDRLHRGAAVTVAVGDVERVHRYAQELRETPMRPAEFVGPQHQPPIGRYRPDTGVDMSIPRMQVGRYREQAAVGENAVHNNVTAFTTGLSRPLASTRSRPEVASGVRLR